ncbi:MAG: hypothetical protein CL878_13325 [Dehalococcoidia bacterium]|nr:hypothetical protein [Dehalococcoidia bacterium]
METADTWRRSGLGLVVLCAGLWLAVSVGAFAYFRATHTSRVQPIYYITGDEPHYLVIATSLQRDGDLDLLNNYRDKHYLPFYPHHLGDPRDMHEMHAIYGRGGAVYSKHPIGLPLMLLPLFRNGDPFGVNILMMVLTGLLGVQVFLLARDLTGALWPSLAAWAAGLFAAPLFLYADQIYPEVPGALLLVIAVRAVLSRQPRWWQALLVGGCVALLPWLHLRYGPTAALVAGTWLLAGGWRRRWQWPLMGLPAVASLAGLLVFYDWLFGGVPAVGEFGMVSLGNIAVGAAGLLLDQQYGLLVYAPVYVLALWGLVQLGWLRVPHAWVPLLVVGTYYAFLASFSYWFGAWSPPARMLVFVAPLLAALIAIPLARWNSPGVWGAFYVLAAAGYWIVYQLLLTPSLRYNLWDGTSVLLAHLSEQWGMELVALFPSYIEPNRVSVIWGIAAPVVLIAAGWLLRRGERRDTEWRSPSRQRQGDDTPRLAVVGSVGRSGS